ncbi:hypothetical protein BOTNAR_0075g00080 [Botryotinia narcissicola]|uniref:nitrilase n=1 Tax=Botryotinia narcissicola TaxID=278944 RepID=A0A4Z1IW22_9HELO|nr:hypothetical protein BOTNAR_0075g00080 [Botryotinia narcissicola]
MGHLEGTTKVPVTQAEPEWLDLEKAVEKTCPPYSGSSYEWSKAHYFPRMLDTWVPSLDLMAQICACAAKYNITVSLGFSENDNNSLYISQAIIGNDGEITMARRKLKPTHMERTVFGDVSGNCLKNVAEVPGIGRIGALACWEHAQPLLKYNTILQKEHFHVAAWPPVFEHDGGPGLWSMSKEGTHNLSQTYAIESQTFVLHTTAVLTQNGIDRMDTSAGALMNTPGGGSSAIFGPDGRKLSADIPDAEEGIIYADLDLDDIVKYKAFIDVGGHYSRPDMLWLGVDDREKKHSRIQEE